VSCPACGTANEPDEKFCGECGAALTAGSTPAAQAREPERRLVTVLFADLVSFTSLSEHRDPEDVRRLLSVYFDRCRVLIERYGGTVEKFIGDAVMAVWGTPVAREDDAERAVRAALALTQAITAVGEEFGVPELCARAGVLTGHAAVDPGAEGQGMVLGDTVNTASRLQSLAAPGTVLVDDVTRRASEASVVYEDAGTHAVKGREQPIHAWTALRVVAGAGGARRGAGVEAPFVGRDRELQAIIEASERTTEESRAERVVVVGEAGTGKSRLLWEFFKYVDGIEKESWWHQGRCLSYGEGVAYWALAEMIRSRAGILEDEPPESARAKLSEAVNEHVQDERERRLVEPRLAHLLRLEERAEADRADLFSGWRLFFERMAAELPVILVFEDLQWADTGLLDFIDYLLEWSAEYPIFILALGRPGLRERRRAWEVLTLEPLEVESVTAILNSLAPGLPADVLAQISRRAEGVPLYAIETIRMLQDRGLLVQEGSRYVMTSEVVDLDVPETLQALVASRLDGLSSGERSLLQDASVLGQAFSAAAAAAVSGRPEEEVVAVLDGLRAKQILGRDDDPRSPERGQYVFLQALLRTVAYGTLSRQARKARHVDAARHLERTWPGEQRDIAEVLASHYLEATHADPDAVDVSELRAAARDRLAAAGRAAASLALGTEAQRYFEQAAELSDDDFERAELFEQAGQALWQSGDADGAEDRLREAIELYARSGRAAGGRATLVLATILRLHGQMDEARSLLEEIRASDTATADRIIRAEALAQLGAELTRSDEPEGAGLLFDEALMVLELEQAWPALANALVNRAAYLSFCNRLEECTGVLRQALVLAERHDLPTVALRVRFTLAAGALNADRFMDAVDECQLGLALARERGDRVMERNLLSQIVAPLVFLGRWDEADAYARTLLEGAEDVDALFGAAYGATVAAARGDEAMLERCVSLARASQESTYIDARISAKLVLARDAIERGAIDEALAHANAVLALHGTGRELTEAAYDVAVEAVIGLDDREAMTALDAYVAALPPALATPLLRGGRARLAAENAHRCGDAETAARLEDEGSAALRSVDARPMLASALLDRFRRRGDREALAEAVRIYEDLGASSWLNRIERTREAVS
jgi:class 3 adenylate cyclase/tetratricopeptide (TPR) repeat protein